MNGERRGQDVSPVSLITTTPLCRVLKAVLGKQRFFCLYATISLQVSYFHPACEVELLITRDKFCDEPKQSATTGVKSFLVPCGVLQPPHHTSAHLSSQWGAPATPPVSPGRAARHPVCLSCRVFDEVCHFWQREGSFKNLQ